VLLKRYSNGQTFMLSGEKFITGRFTMKRVYLAGAALTAIMAAAGSAIAADMPLKAPVMAPAAYDWSGMYIGGVVGGGWETTDTTSGFGPVFAGGAPSLITTSSSGFIGGIEGGSNYQIGKLVIGWEADWLWGGINGTSSTAFGPVGAPATALIAINTPWTGTATSRVGIAHDRWLVYGKAGVAYEHTNFTGTASSAAFPGLLSSTGADTRTGWTVGTGVEWAVWDAWSIKAEYDYMDFGNRALQLNGTAFAPPGVPVALSPLNEQRISEFKFGVNWKFMPNLF
jgi:outer membrane immunogenic protein